MLQGFRLAHAGVGIAHRGGNQLLDALDLGAVLLLPVQVVVPRVLVPDQPHGWISSRSSYSPVSARSLASSSRRALTGLRRRYAVSRQESKSSLDTRTALVPSAFTISTGSWSSLTWSIRG